MARRKITAKKPVKEKLEERDLKRIAGGKKTARKTTKKAT
jgi:hypothetical protein